METTTQRPIASHALAVMTSAGGYRIDIPRDTVWSSPERVLQLEIRYARIGLEIVQRVDIDGQKTFRVFNHDAGYDPEWIGGRPMVHETDWLKAFLIPA